ncbi:hypothetical protein CPB83DRAFT_767869 [Crepidotus variabilis]|uniref:Uncharacterized protein n=1 Tax=Crepidotus variabilis TaxID=179855 RepID=A0A9P6EEN4_9AGAR|nr:hypothetical protein CPB83DRAFT_767869 [Crepidotus variabilis]
MQDEDVFGAQHSSLSPNQRESSSSRLYVPQHDTTQIRPRSSAKSNSGLTPPVRRGSPLNPQNVNSSSPSGRRSWQPDPTSSPSDSSLRHKKVPSNLATSLARITDPPSTEGDTELEIGVFSNEYDLDPRILQDVQRALKLKARREARLKRETMTITPDRPRSSTSQVSPSSSSFETPPKQPFPSSFSPSPSFSIDSSHRKSSNSTTSEVDFSPSTGGFDVQHKPHPVPSSADNGASLDWTGGTSSDGERKWTKSIVRKRDKDTLPPLGVMMDQQEQLHKDKLAKINNFASAQTRRKANITSEQLSRRYSLIYASLNHNKLPFNLAKVTKWYTSQPEVARKSLERHEPFTWLKHLDKRSQNSTRSPWNLSAHIMEDYLSTQERDRHMQTIPEDSPLQSPTLPFKRNSRPPSFNPSPRSTQDERISFEPLGDSKRSSWDALSYESGVGSGGSNIGLHVPAFQPISPSSSRFSDTGKVANPSLDRTRSPSTDFSDTSDEDDLPESFSSPPRLQVSTSLTVPEVSIVPPSTSSGPKGSFGAAGPISQSNSGSSSSTKPLTSAANNRSMVSLRAPMKHKSRLAAPSSTRPLKRSKKYREEREEQLRTEYDAKALLLREGVLHNTRIRQLLNRISTALKDYDSLQTLTPEILSITMLNVPKELVEAFGHDPAGVTGSTRRLQGWQAVEDIHQRILRQRRTFSSFLDTFEGLSPTDGCALDKPMETLFELLAALKAQKQDIVNKAEEVEVLLEEVQKIQGQVKEQYNKTVSHVSVVYPQLSHIVALEESYKDQYQQFWELGMDALTLLLDTVTPFWRTYGKLIGEDVCDFLIIPLYRNEFTGETKRYRIEKLPRRTLRHWFGLGVFFLTSIGVNILQIRAAISSTLHFRLSSIPYDGVRWTALPFFWISIIIQWFAALFEFAVVVMELGVILWWTGWMVKIVS